MILRGGRFSDEAIFSNLSNFSAKETASAVVLPRRFMSALTLEPPPLFDVNGVICQLARKARGAGDDEHGFVAATEREWDLGGLFIG